MLEHYPVSYNLILMSLVEMFIIYVLSLSNLFLLINLIIDSNTKLFTFIECFISAYSTYLYCIC